MTLLLTVCRISSSCNTVTTEVTRVRHYLRLKPYKIAASRRVVGEEVRALSQAHMETLRDCTRLVTGHPPVGKLSTHNSPTKSQPLVVMTHGDLGAMYPGLDKLCRHLRLVSVSDTAPHCYYAPAIHVWTNQDIRGD